MLTFVKSCFSSDLFRSISLLKELFAVPSYLFARVPGGSRLYASVGWLFAILLKKAGGLRLAGSGGLG